MGEEDTVVSPDNSYKMFNKLSKNNRPVEIVKLPKGEHWRTNEANEITALKAIDKFLAAHLKAGTH